jgi:hypothetical protein
MRLRQSSGPSLFPRVAALLCEPSAHQPIVVGGFIGKRDPVAVGCLNQRQAMLARQSHLGVACGVDRTDLACQTGQVSVGRDQHAGVDNGSSTITWQDEALAKNVQVALDDANYARRRPGWEPQDACGDYFDALNQLCTTLLAGACRR